MNQSLLPDMEEELEMEEEELGYVPQVSGEDGVKRTLGFFYRK